MRHPRKRIILASSSPQRKQLLRQLIGGKFIVWESSYTENHDHNMSPEEMVVHHAREKGREVAGHFKTGLVIAADTIVLLENQILGKPHTPEIAREMLRRINGRLIQVISGIAVIDIDSGRELTDFEVTRVRMKQMSVREIEHYIESGEPLDKAGAFGIQGIGAILVESIEGCYFNVVGLPLFKLNSLLAELGISIFNL